MQDELTFGKKISAKNEDSEVPEGLDEPLLTVYVPMEDYMLGLADLTGRLRHGVQFTSVDYELRRNRANCI